MKQLILILMLAVSGWCANYYFANTGSDATGNGTIDNPWATITKYNNQTAADGDSLLYKYGDQWYGIRAIPKNGGTSNYIYTAAYGDTTKPLPIISAGRLVSGAGFEWHLSSHGTNEYYLTLTGGSNPSITSRPIPIWVNDEALDTFTIGSLLDHQYNWGDNDALGFSTIYLRLDAGDPDVTGDTIVTTKEQNALYASAKSNLYFKNIHYKHGSGDVVRYLSSTNVVFDKCVFSHSNQGFKFETVTNSILKSCKIKHIWNTTYQGLYFLTNATGNKVATTEIYDCGGYGALIATGSSVDFINVNLLKCRLGAFRSTSTADCNLINTQAIACGFGNQQTIQKGGTGAVNIKNSCPFDGMKLDLDMISGCTDQGGNIYQYPKFVKEPHVGYVIPRLDDWTLGSNAEDIFTTYTDSLTKYAPNSNMSWNISKTDIITPEHWAAIKALYDAGWDIGVHTRGHIDVSPSTAFTIQYTGSGTYCRLFVVPDTLNRTVRLYTECDNAGDVFDYSCGISDGVNYRLGSTGATPRDGIIKTINDLPNYTCNSQVDMWYSAKSFVLKAVSAQDIKTSLYTAEASMYTMYHEEFYMCLQDMKAGIGNYQFSMAYPNTNSNRDSIIPFLINYCPDIISGSTVSATSGTLFRKLPIYEMSCMGSSEIAGANYDQHRIKAQSLAALMCFWGGSIAVLTHDLTAWKADSLALFAKAIQDMGSRCRVGSQRDATLFVKNNGYALNDRTWRWYQPDSSNFQLKKGSPCENKGDKTAITGISNLYTLDGVQLTNASGTVLVDSINIGAYGTYESNTPPSIGTQPVNDTTVNGGSASFTVSVSGTEPLSYKWTQAGDSVGTTNTLSLSNVTLGMSGNYYKCVVTNEFGSVTSDSALLVVEEVRIDSIRPSPWYRNRTVSIYGKWFGTPQGSDSVLVGGINNHRAASWSNTQIVDTLPDTMGVFQVNVKGATKQLRILKPRAR